VNEAEEPELPLTPREKVTLTAGATMFAAQLVVAVVLAPRVTGEHANAAALLALWAGAIPWSVAAVLLLVRRPDLPDVATASMLVTIASFATFTLVAALAARGTEHEVDVVDTLFLGVTTGALTALIVWGCAMGVARALRR
jgi:hypothetical protein